MVVTLDPHGPAKAALTAILTVASEAASASNLREAGAAETPSPLPP